MASPSAIGLQPALRSCWHPVAFAHDVECGPLGARLLDEPLVVWRDSTEAARAFSDLCVHRGTALSLGSVEDDEIVCPYHGWRYGADGACTLIPQLEDPKRVPQKARATSFRCRERYGIVWVALDEPRWPLPEVPELESDDWRTVLCGPYEWQCDASRQVENFTDFGHFTFVHPGLLGDPNRPVVPRHEVEIDGHVLRYEIVRPEAPNTDDFPVFANEEQERPVRRNRYQLHLPYTIVLRLGWGGEEEVVVEFEDVIFGQDQRVVESQRPEQVPFDLAAELHLRFDAVAVVYRRAMRDQGLAR